MKYRHEKEKFLVYCVYLYELRFQLLEWFDKVSEKHDKWVGFVSTYGLRKEDAEDIVQQMYINLYDFVTRDRNTSDKRVSAKYKGLCPDQIMLTKDKELKESYVYKVIQNMVFKRSKTKVHNEPWNDNLDQIEDKTDNKEFNELRTKICEILSMEHWYFEKIYNYYTESEGVSIRDLQIKTGISKSTLQKDLKKIEHILRDKAQHHYKTYKKKIA